LKCADSAIIEYEEDGLRVHIVELKSKLTPTEWAKVRLQFLGTVNNLYAIAGISRLPAPKKITCYIAYKQDDMDNIIHSPSSILKVPVGGSKSLGGIEDWKSGYIDLMDHKAVSIVKILRDTSGNGTATLV
jgi:hypothetical protein